MVTDTAPYRYPHYHKASDTMDKIDFENFTKAVEGFEGSGATIGESVTAKAEAGLLGDARHFPGFFAQKLGDAVVFVAEDHLWLDGLLRDFEAHDDDFFARIDEMRGRLR